MGKLTERSAWTPIRHWHDVSRQDMDGPSDVDHAFEAVVDDLMALSPADRQKAAQELHDAQMYRYGDLGQACMNRSISLKTRALLSCGR